MTTILIWNAATESGNLGVQALGFSLIAGIQERLPNAAIHVAVSGDSVRRRECAVQGGRTLQFTEFGASLSRNPLKRGNIGRDLRLHRVFGRSMSTFLLRLVRSADVVVDISGGDSFTTLYGDLRYRYVNTPKRLALELNRPLVLAPQTYGPFDDAHAGDAAGIIRQASMAWGRDLRAASYLKANGLEGNWCPDVAFTLPVGQAPVLETDRPMIGVNVSGLLWHPEPARVRDRFDISLDYKALMRHVVSSLMSRHPGHAIVLIPHVLTSPGSMEDDQMAATELRSSMGSDGSSLQVAPPFSNPMDAKALIGKCDIMVGTRMHACIAGLSSGVPTIGFGYSHKTKPVFETVSMQEFVVDLPRAPIEAATAQFDEALAQADGARPALQESVVGAKTAVGSFFDALLGVL